MAAVPPVDILTRPVPSVLVAPLVAGLVLVYLGAVRRVRSAGGYWPRRRVVAFAWCVALVLFVAYSGLAHFAPSNFTAVASIYLSAALVAPALLALAAPVSLLRQAGGVRENPPVPAPAVPALPAGSHAAGDDPGPARLPARRILTHPAVILIAYTASLFAVFLSGLFSLALRNTWACQIEGVAVFALGFAFWYPVVAVDPFPWRMTYWRRILYLLLVFPVFGIAGMALQSDTRPLVRTMPLGSQHLGSAILWVAGETLALTGIMAVFVQWLRDDERAARRHDEQSSEAAARQLALWRASREAAARAAGPS